MQTTIANITVQTGMSALHKVILKIINEIESHSIYFEIETGSFYLMMEEALINAMEHGNRWDSKKTINISLKLDDAALFIIIADEGEGFCQLALTGNSENSEKQGIRIIRKFCNAYWNDKGNAIYLKLALIDSKQRLTSNIPQESYNSGNMLNTENLIFSRQSISPGPSDP